MRLATPSITLLLLAGIAGAAEAGGGTPAVTQAQPDAAQDPRTLTEDQRRAEEARITAAIAAAKASLDADQQPQAERASALLQTFRQQATALTDHLKRQALSEPRAVNAHDAAARIQETVLRDSASMLLGTTPVPDGAGQFLRDDTQQTLVALAALVDRSAADFRPLAQRIRDRHARYEDEVAKLQAQHPAARLADLDRLATEQVAGIAEEVRDTVKAARTQAAGLPAVGSRTAFVERLNAMEERAKAARDFAGAMLTERVEPLAERCRALAVSVQDLPTAEKAIVPVLERTDALVAELQQRKQADPAVVLAHHRALFAALPDDHAPAVVAMALAGIDADRAAHPAEWSDAAVSDGWSSLTSVMVVEVARSPALAELSLEEAVAAVVAVRQADARGAISGRYAPVVTALAGVKAVRQPAEADGLAALVTLDQQIGVDGRWCSALRVAIEDGVGEAQRVAAGEKSLATVNAWAVTRPLALTAEARAHHIALLNRLGANTTGPAMAGIKREVDADIAAHPAHWRDQASLVALYRQLQLEQYKGWFPMMRTKREDFLAGLRDFQRGERVNWSLIDADDARAMSLLASEALSANLVPEHAGFWQRAAMEK